jgi:hypothetical protein
MTSRLSGPAEKAGTAMGTPDPSGVNNTEMAEFTGSNRDPLIVRRPKGDTELVESDDIVSPVGGGDCVTVKVCPSTVIVPVRWLVPVLAATA